MTNISDRAFGLVVVLVALAYIAGATQIETSFLADPVGPRTFPILIGAVAALCGTYMLVKPDPEPEWPGTVTALRIAFSVVVLIAYAMLLKPMGFLAPTAVAAAVLSYQISPRPLPAIAAGFGLSIGLFLLFRFALGLSLAPWPRGLFG